MSKLNSLPRQRFEGDWYGNPIAFNAEFVLAADREFLHLRAWCSLTPNCDFEWKSGEFVEGLWKRDVVELFLRSPTNRTYREWNVSPVGAWWSARFLDVRAADPGFIPGRERTRAVGQAAPGIEGWSVSISIPRDDFLSSTPSAMNVTMIAGGVHLSCCPELDREPDFHNVASYPIPEVELVSGWE